MGLRSEIKPQNECNSKFSINPSSIFLYMCSYRDFMRVVQSRIKIIEPDMRRLNQQVM